MNRSVRVLIVVVLLAAGLWLRVPASPAAAQTLDSDWATGRVIREVPSTDTAATRALPVPNARVNTSGDVYVLAMGANTQGLTKADADARNFAAMMQSLFQVPTDNIRLYEKAYRKDFADGMQWLRTHAKPNDLVLILFSGHGSTVPDNDKDEADGFDEVFVMYDVNGAQRASHKHVVLDDEFAKWVNAIPSDRIVIFIDACHSGGFSKELTGGRSKFFIGGELGDLPANQSAKKPAAGSGHEDLAGGMDGKWAADGLHSITKGLIYAAAQEDQEAQEVADGGLFVTRFLEWISRSKDTDLATLFKETSRRVEQETNSMQTPVAVGVTELGAGLRLAAPANTSTASGKR